jgi:hypothetical protein
LIIRNLNYSSQPNCQPENPPCSTPDCWFAYWNTSSQTLNERNRAIRGILHPGFDTSEVPLYVAYDTILLILEDRNTPEDKMLRIGTLAAWGNYFGAQTALSQMPDTTEKYSTYIGYMTLLLDSQEDLMNLPAEDYRAALSYLDSVNTSSQSMAQAFHFLRSEAYHPLIPLSSGGGQQAKGLPGNTIIATLPGSYPTVIATPNPFFKTVSFNISGFESEDNVSISVFDLNGKEVWRTNVTGNGSVVMVSEGLPTGYYFFSVRSSSGEVHRGKIAKTGK